MLQARDAGGTIVANLAPYMTNVYTAARLRKGLPIPMKCTYNGMAVINAAPFRLHNLRFRWESQLGLRTCWDALYLLCAC